MEKGKGKNISGILLLTVFLICLAAGAGFAQTCGDVNNSGKADIVDALAVAQYSAGISVAVFNSSVADVDGSGTINILDALRIAQYSAGLVASLSCTTITPTPTPTITTRTPTPTPTVTGTAYTGNATWFDNLGSPYGGCGLPQTALDTQWFVALNVQNTPGDYSTMLTRPIAASYGSKIGMWNNGLNCGRWVHVTVSDYCNGSNDGAPGAGFCHGGTGWVSDAYNGAALDMIIADSCQDANGWCRDDPYHVDLAHAALNNFIKDGKPVADMDPAHWNNRHVTWQFIEAPNYAGDIKIGFNMNAQIWWVAIAVTHLKNGIHGIDYYNGSAWVKAKMNADMGQSYIIEPTTTGGSNYRIRVYDVNDQLINNGRIYNFSYPTSSCGTNCSVPFTEVTYTTE